MERPKLTGDRNECPACGELFNSSIAFERHRVAAIPPHAFPRRCLTADEMDARGMAKNAAGFRVVRLMAWRPGLVREPAIACAST